MAPNPIPMVMIGFYIIATVVVSATAAYEPSSSSSFAAENWKNPIEDIVRDSTVNLEEDPRSHLLPPTPGCSTVALPKLGGAMSNATTSSAMKCGTCSSKKPLAASIIAKAPPRAVKTLTATTAAVPTAPVAPSSPTVSTDEEALEAWHPLQENDAVQELDIPAETLRASVEEACAHIDEHDKRVACMIHQVLAKKGAESPLSIERDGTKVQVVSMLQDDQVIFEDTMDDASLLQE